MVADEQEAGRELDGRLRSGDADDALLERLAETVEHGGLELGELVEQEHAAVGEAGFAGPHRGRAAADHGDERGRVVRRPQRRPRDEPAARAARRRPPNGPS